MTSELKSQTNRQNALLSTGPRTPGGKAAARMNAVRHGMTCAEVVIRAGPFAESEQEYGALLAELQADLQPEGALESALVEQVAACLWRRRRVLRFERGVIEQRLSLIQLHQVVQRAAPPEGRPRAFPIDDPYQRLRSSASVRRLLLLLDDVRAHVRQLGTLPSEDKARLIDAFGAVRGGVALRCAAHSSMAEEARNESRPHLRPADWHVEQIISALDGETARLEVLLPQLEELERAMQEATRAQAAVPDEAALDRLVRYEAHISRELHRTLDRLERLQRRRSGDAVLPPVQVDLSVV